MENIELAVTDEAILTNADQQAFELSLFELDLVGGGSAGLILA